MSKLLLVSVFAGITFICSVLALIAMADPEGRGRRHAWGFALVGVGSLFAAILTWVLMP